MRAHKAHVRPGGLWEHGGLRTPRFGNWESCGVSRRPSCPICPIGPTAEFECFSQESHRKRKGWARQRAEGPNGRVLLFQSANQPISRALRQSARVFVETTIKPRGRGRYPGRARGRAPASVRAWPGWRPRQARRGRPPGVAHRGGGDGRVWAAEVLCRPRCPRPSAPIGRHGHGGARRVGRGSAVEAWPGHLSRDGAVHASDGARGGDAAAWVGPHTPHRGNRPARRGSSARGTRPARRCTRAQDRVGPRIRHLGSRWDRLPVRRVVPLGQRPARRQTRGSQGGGMCSWRYSFL